MLPSLSARQEPPPVGSVCLSTRLRSPRPSASSCLRASDFGGGGGLRGEDSHNSSAAQQTYSQGRRRRRAAQEQKSLLLGSGLQQQDLTAGATEKARRENMKGGGNGQSCSISDILTKLHVIYNATTFLTKNIRIIEVRQSHCREIQLHFTCNLSMPEPLPAG